MLGRGTCEILRGVLVLVIGCLGSLLGADVISFLSRFAVDVCYAVSVSSMLQIHYFVFIGPFQFYQVVINAHTGSSTAHPCFFSTLDVVIVILTSDDIKSYFPPNLVVI